MTQHRKIGEGVEARAREVLASEISDHVAAAKVGAGVDRLISTKAAVRAMIAFADEARQSLAREPATADVGREAIALIRDWRKLVRLENVKARAGTDLPRDAIDMFQADMYTRWPAWRVDEIIAALSRAAPSSEPEWVMPTPAEERAKMIAGYAGPVVSFDVVEPYYLASCDGCGWVGSSGACSSDEADDVFCPRCFASGADCGKVAERITAPSSEPAIAEGERLEMLAVKCLADRGRAEYANPNVIRAMMDFAALATTPPTTNDAIPAGWKLVPAEPTARMIAAGWGLSDLTVCHETHHWKAEMRTAWSAMLSAAPSAPATEAGERA